MAGSPDRRDLLTLPGDLASLVEALPAALDGSGPAIEVVPGVESARRTPAAVDARAAVVVRTSGSTSRPKRVALASAAFSANAAAVAAAAGQGPGVLALPTEYIAGLVVVARAVIAGGEVVEVARNTAAPFTAERFVEAARRALEAASRSGAGPLVSLVPRQLEILARSPEAVSLLTQFSRVLVGGQRTDHSVMARLRDAGVPVTATYGATETCGGVLWDGRPLAPDVEARIVDSRVLVSSPSLALGYLRDDGAVDDERTVAGFCELDGRRWYRSDDQGELDAEGRLRVTGRIDDVIVTGGVKVSLGEVEAVVRVVPGLESAVVIGAPSSWGASPVVVVASEGPTPNLDEVRSRVEAQLGAAARPIRIVSVAQLPLLSSGKLDRRALAATVGAEAVGDPGQADP